MVTLVKLIGRRAAMGPPVLGVSIGRRSGVSCTLRRQTRLGQDPSTVPMASNSFGYCYQQSPPSAGDSDKEI